MTSSCSSARRTATTAAGRPTANSSSPSFEDDGGTYAAAGRLRMALWSHHLDVHPSDVADPVSSRALWDTASTRHVCRYDPGGGDDSRLHDRPDYFVDPSDRQPGDPCRTLLPHP